MGTRRIKDLAGNGDGVHQRGSEEMFSAKEGFAVTPSDSDDLTRPIRSFYTSVGGSVKVTTVLGDDLTFDTVVAGTVMPIQCRRIWSTGTTATGIVGLV